MNLIEVVLPSLGDEDDAVQGGRVSELMAAVGDTLKKDDDLMELITDKAAFVLPSPAHGVLHEWRVSEGDVVKVGQVLCLLQVIEEG